MNQNVICWFEIYVGNLDRAKKFYHEVLGTNFFDMPTPGDNPDGMKMSMFTPPTDDGSFVSGALIEMPGGKEGQSSALNTIVYFPCQDCSVEESRVVGAGGKVHQPKMDIGEFGFCSICIDSEGNTFGLFSMS